MTETPDNIHRIYTQARWSRLLAETIRQIEDLSRIKGGEYAGGLDRLANFRRNARDMDMLPEQVWRVYAGKHWDAVNQWIKDTATGGTRPRAEPIAGRADDLIVYLILLKAMIEEREGAPPIAETLGLAVTETPQLCSHQWHKLDRYSDTCVFCNSMRPHPGRG